MMTIMMQTIVFSLLLASVHSLLVSTQSTKRNIKINNAIKPYYNRNTKSIASAVYMSTDLNNVKDLVLTEKNSLSRSELNEYILQLEKLNPTEDPALSPLLNGVWEVISSGKLSYFPMTIVLGSRFHRHDIPSHIISLLHLHLHRSLQQLQVSFPLDSLVFRLSSRYQGLRSWMSKMLRSLSPVNSLESLHPPL